MASSSMFTILEESRVSPPPATVRHRVLPLTYFDFLWLTQPPIHYLFFYDLPITRPQFIQTIVPKLKHSLSITLQHFFPFAGRLFVYLASTKHPEIRYVEGDDVEVTFAEEPNLDFNQLTANHPRDCGLFYGLIPFLGQAEKSSDSTNIRVFSLQVTLFPGSGISIGMTNHHCLGDASTRFNFMKAWTTIAQNGTDESFLANGTLPFYERVVNPKLEKSYLKFAKVENFKEHQKLCGPTDKVRATFVLPRNVLTRLKHLVSTEVRALAYISSFTVTCAYIWSCIATTSEDDEEDELQLFTFPIDCRARLNPPMPTSYFGNCVGGCMTTEKTSQLRGKHGFVNATKMIGASLHKTLSDKDGLMKEIESFADLFPKGMPKTRIGVGGTPKLNFYEMDFGWGKPRKIEKISMDYTGAISINAGKERSEDIEIGVCLPSAAMEHFVRVFDYGLQAYI